MDFLIDRADYDLLARKIQQSINELEDSQRVEVSKQMQEKIYQSKITVENLISLALGFSLIQVFKQKPQANLFPKLKRAGPGSDGAFTLTVDSSHDSWLQKRTESQTIEEIVELAVEEYTDRIPAH